MTSKRRGIFVGVVLAAVATASLAAAFAAYVQRLPDPESADRRGLFRWLIERDLRTEPWELRMTLVNRVEQEMLAGVDLRQVATMLNPNQCQRLIENGDELARCWFVREADHYAAAAPDQRSALIGEQIAHVRRLGIMDQLSAIEQWSADRFKRSAGDATVHSGAATGAASSSSAAATGPMAFASNTQRIDRWIAESAPAQKSKLNDFFVAIRGRLLVDAVRSWLPFPSAAVPPKN